MNDPRHKSLREIMFIQGLNIPKYGKTGRKLIPQFLSFPQAAIFNTWCHVTGRVQPSAHRGLESSYSPLITWVNYDVTRVGTLGKMSCSIGVRLGPIHPRVWIELCQEQERCQSLVGQDGVNGAICNGQKYDVICAEPSGSESSTVTWLSIITSVYSTNTSTIPDYLTTCLCWKGLISRVIVRDR
jgi:hypothetical protein